jgi:glycosyltransferase involved in cell wall biosynthesis
LTARLSVIVPCYNEEETIYTLLKKVLEQELVESVIVIDDYSSDDSIGQISRITDKRVKLLRHSANKGKGAAITSGIVFATSELVVIQDADLEYDPQDYKSMVIAFDEHGADVVYGSRFLTSGPRRAVYYWHRLGNGFLTHLSNAFTNLYLTDMETCYKMMRREVAQALDIKENRFGLEPEITAKISAMRLKVYEVPIGYNSRTYDEGKKITWKDGFSAIRCIIRYNLPKTRKGALNRYLKALEANRVKLN